MDGLCIKHSFEKADNTCRNCGMEFCNECLVYSFGPKKPPFCIPCALGKSGVRSGAARPQTRPKRDIRRVEKERKRAEKASKKAKSVDVEVEAYTWSAPPPDETPDNADNDNPFAWADDQESNRVVPF